MSKYQTIRAIRDEISRLNREIDLKIIRGLSYARESRRHRMLSAQLSRLVSNRTTNWFSKSLSYVSLFLL